MRVGLTTSHLNTPVHSVYKDTINTISDEKETSYFNCDFTLCIAEMANSGEH